MTKMEEICSVSFVDHEAASELLREFTGKEGGVATVDWYLLRNKIADAISMTRFDEREKFRPPLSEAWKREKEARAKALEEAALRVDAKAEGYEAEARDLRGSEQDRRFCASVAVRMRGAAADIRALQSEER